MEYTDRILSVELPANLPANQIRHRDQFEKRPSPYLAVYLRRRRDQGSRATLHHRVACRVSLRVAVGWANNNCCVHGFGLFFAHAERRAAGSWLKI